MYLSVLKMVPLPRSPWSLPSQFSWSLENFGDIAAAPLVQFRLPRLRVENVQLAFGKDARHMFIEPFDFISSSKSEILRFLSSELRDLLIFVKDPFR